MQPLDPLTQALADAVALYRDSRADGAVLDALRAAADECCTQLRAVQDAAVAQADEAMQRLSEARQGRDPAAVARAYRRGELAMAHAERVSAQVVAALEDLLAGTVELTSPALARLQRGLAVTQSLIAAAELTPPTTPQRDPQ